MNALSSTAMVLAAGLGTRMRPLTLTTPKPLVTIGGRAMLDHALDKLAAAGIRRAVVNTFYLAEQIEAHLAKRDDMEIIISRETQLLDTGGGIKNTLTHFDNLPFIAVNADMPWIDGPTPSLNAMIESWRPAMQALLLIMPTAKAWGFPVTGDFNLESSGLVRRHNIAPPRSHVCLGAQIVRPELFNAIPDPIFSNNRIWDNAETAAALYGLEHTGTCYHVGTEADWRQANALLANGQGWGRK